METKPQDRPLDSQGKLSGKTFIITGGTGLFGLSLAQAIRDEGANVILSCFSEIDPPMFVEPDCLPRRLAGSLVWATGDTRDPQYCLELVRYACRTFGRLDGLINNADYEFQPLWPPERLPSRTARRTSIHFGSVTENLHQAALEGVAPGGVVIHSLGPQMEPAIGHPLIPVTGPGSRSSEQQLGDLGIRVLNVRPGPAWNAGMVEKFPLHLSRHHVLAMRQQNQTYIQLLAE